MAKKIFYQLVDDLDGRVLADGSGESVRFGLDGAVYEIDLSREHAAELRSLLEPYRKAGRVDRRPGGRAGRSRTAAPRDLAAIRRWAKANGLDVAERGRIPNHVITAYESERP